MAGTPDGVLNHTVSGQDYFNLWFNGTLVGETGINAAFCGTWNCPVLLVTGDEAACREGTALLGDGLTTVAVKTGLGVKSARQNPPRAGAGADRGRREAGALEPEGGRALRTRAARARSRSSSSTPAASTSSATARASTGRSPDDHVTADTWWEAWTTFYF